MKTTACRRIIKILTAVLFSVLIIAGTCCATADEIANYRTLKKGDKGEDVLALKERMYYLGYFTSLNFSDQYNNTTVERIKMLQKNNGLKQTGIATPELQKLIFSQDCVWKAPTPQAAPDTTPAAAPSGTPVSSFTPVPSFTPAPEETQKVRSLPETEDTVLTAPVESLRTLKKGDEGRDVLALKERMYYLGYFNSLKSLSDQYNGTMVERIKLLQKNNGLEETGIATPELQVLIYSSRCVYQAPTPQPTPKPSPTPPPLEPQDHVILPERDADGFLASGEPFIYADRDEGHWIYLSEDIFIEIKQYTDKQTPLIWLETYIRLREGKKLTSLQLPGKKKTNFKKPWDILANYEDDTHTVVLAFSDDFYPFRTRFDKGKEGVVIRDSQIMAEDTVKENSTRFPPLEVLAVFPDGTFKTYESNEYTAQEYLDMGVTDTYVFGPVLIQNGKLNETIYKNYKTTNREPRTALGMLAPNEYFVLTVTGRRSDSKGSSIPWLAEKMMEKGVVEAINLDGGNTCTLIFMGDIINRTKNVKTKDIRNVSGLIGVIEESSPDPGLAE